MITSIHVPFHKHSISTATSIAARPSNHKVRLIFRNGTSFWLDRARPLKDAGDGLALGGQRRFDLDLRRALISAPIQIYLQPGDGVDERVWAVFYIARELYVREPRE